MNPCNKDVTPENFSEKDELVIFSPLVGHSVGSETFKLRHTKLQRMVAKDIGHQNVQLHLLPI